MEEELIPVVADKYIVLVVEIVGIVVAFAFAVLPFLQPDVGGYIVQLNVSILLINAMLMILQWQ